MSLKQSLVKLEGWEDFVTIVSSDMRDWDAPEKADILVGIQSFCEVNYKKGRLWLVISFAILHFLRFSTFQPDVGQ